MAGSMKNIHAKSAEFQAPQTDFFTIPQTQVRVLKTYMEHFYPKSALGMENMPIQFQVQGSGDLYIDMRFIMLFLKLRIVKRDGGKIKSKTLRELKTQLKVAAEAAAAAKASGSGSGSGSTPAAKKKTSRDEVAEDSEEEEGGTGATTAGEDNVGPVNGLLSALFENVEVRLNGTQVTPQTRYYHTQADMENTLGYCKEAKESHMQNQLYYEDTPGYEDDIMGKNKGLQARKKFSDNSNEFEVYGPLLCGVFGSGRYLLNEVEMNVILTRTPSAFYLMSDKDEYKIEITKAVLMVRKVEMSPSFLAEMNVNLRKESAIYPYRRREIRTFKIMPDETIKIADHLFPGEQPVRVIIGFVDEEAFQGHIGKNPFKYENLDITRLAVFSAGQQYPAVALTPDFSNPGCSTLSFDTTFEGTGIHYGDEGNGITRLNYVKGGKVLWCFDLTQDGTAAAGTHWNTVRVGSFRVEVNLRESPSRPIVGIVYREFDSVMNIDANRRVTVTGTSTT